MKHFLLMVSVLVAGVVLAGTNAVAKTGARYPKGALLLTFDDRHFAHWVAAAETFAKYGAHATFFPCGDFNPGELKLLKKLHNAGHSIGIHSLKHADIPGELKKFGPETAFKRQFAPQLAKLATVGIKPTAIAYPNNRHNAETDEWLVKRGFRRFRAGKLTRYDPKKEHPVVIWATTDAAFFPAEELPERTVLEGLGVGDFYRTDIEDVCLAIRRASEKGEALVTYSHDIAEHPTGISMYTDWLERILKTASECGMSVIGFDEISR